jgi:hypothetical protein
MLITQLKLVSQDALGRPLDKTQHVLVSIHVRLVPYLSHKLTYVLDIAQSDISLIIQLRSVTISAQETIMETHQHDRVY